MPLKIVKKIVSLAPGWGTKTCYLGMTVLGTTSRVISTESAGVSLSLE
jgi:hypothetical protein